MRIPVIAGLIDRRILINYRVRPETLGSLLPKPFRPQLVGGWGLAGICLIRLRHVRPRGLPGWLGISSENAALRVAVEWDAAGSTNQGVYVWRRDTNSPLNALAGGRIFPGRHHRSRFEVREANDCLEVSIDNDANRLFVAARLAPGLPAGSIFDSLEAASRFFEAGSIGYSATSDAARFEGLQLQCLSWQVVPLQVDRLCSSFFDDPSRFPASSIQFDCALLMRGIEHQ
jgi:hypothetical protein